MRSERRDSNSRPQPWQGCALPAELLSHASFEKWCKCTTLNRYYASVMRNIFTGNRNIRSIHTNHTMAYLFVIIKSKSYKKGSSVSRVLYARFLPWLLSFIYDISHEIPQSTYPSGSQAIGRAAL